MNPSARKAAEKLFRFFFNPSFRHRFERVILGLSIGSFLLHLLLIFLHDLQWVDFGQSADELFISPITAIYTPFSFILVFEVYMLVYHLPDSFTISIGKQYEIISLIVVRRIFKDISKLDISESWGISYRNQLLAADMLCILVLFGLIFWFYKLRQQRPRLKQPSNIDEFVVKKKGISGILAPMLFLLAIYSFGTWVLDLQQFNIGQLEELPDINKVFYNEFFTLMILFDVLILMISLQYTDNYSQLIRNAGFVISTVLIRLSFTAEGLFNPVLITIGVLFGTLMLALYNKMGHLEAERANEARELT
ncbi:hypothetical protein [Phaeodactylibacter xiamenensis]|jgi:hypothetical protein|uniref:hypothetical protein n=1 Tax=Phaeodactylibacter xiamenensis TaxID=1524460 RepID=UPI003BAC5F1D